MLPGDLILKDPDSVEPYGFDWSAFLTDIGPNVQIATSEWIIVALNGESPSALTFDDEDVIAVDSLDVKTIAYFESGTLGARYKITNRIVTDSVPAVTDDRSVTMKVVHR